MKLICRLAVFITFAVASLAFQTENGLLDEVQLRLMEPAVVPDPVDGVSRWWYTPSRKAHLYNRKSYGQQMDGQLRQGEDLRLPGDLLPRFYNVRLLPFVEVGNFTTSGEVQITFDCIVPTVNISLNSLDLTIDLTSINVIIRRHNSNILDYCFFQIFLAIFTKVTDELSGASIQTVKFIDEQSTRERVTIQVANPLTAGRKYIISMKFISILNNLLAGFYRSSYVEGGVTKYSI